MDINKLPAFWGIESSPLTEEEDRELYAFLDGEEQHPWECGEFGDGFICCRTMGHDGAHVAIGMKNVLAIWYTEGGE